MLKVEFAPSIHRFYAPVPPILVPAPEDAVAQSFRLIAGAAWEQFERLWSADQIVTYVAVGSGETPLPCGQDNSVRSRAIDVAGAVLESLSLIRGKVTRG